MAAAYDFDTVQHLLWTFAQHRIITVATRTGLMRRLAEGAVTAEEAASSLQLAAEPCGKIIRSLVALGLARRLDGGFVLRDEFRPLFSGDDDLTPFVAHSHRMYDVWGENLEDWLCDGRWPGGQRTAEQIEAFGAAMQSIGRYTARLAEPCLELGGVRHVLDVGGGLGHWAELYCRRHESLKVTVFDIPKNAEAGTRLMAEKGLGDRITFRGGDYLSDDLGGGFDLVMIAGVLHQEPRDEAARLIKRASRATSENGRVAVVDFRIDEDRCGPLLGALFAVHMRDFGDTWSEADIRGWMHEAGLGLVQRRDAGPDRWVITGTKVRTE